MKAIKDKTLAEKYFREFPYEEYFSFDLREFVSIIRFEPGDVIMREGDRPEYLYFLAEGRAKIYMTHENGRVLLINFPTAPCFFGEMEMLDEEKLSNGVIAVTTCICFAIRIRECKDQILNDTKFLRYLCGFLSRKAVGNTDNYSKNQIYPLKNRLARFILMTENHGIYRERQTEVAEFLGVTYRHLLYVMAEFVKMKLLKKTPQGYRICDREMLKELAGEEI